MKNDIQFSQTPPSVPRWILWLGFVAITVIFSRRWLSQHADASVTLRTMVALSPVPILLMQIRYALGNVRRVDELQELIYYKSWWFAGIAMMFLFVALKQAQLAGLQLPESLSQGFEYDHALGAFALFVFGSGIWFNRRYK
jgi:uncharacterized membrane protein